MTHWVEASGLSADEIERLHLHGWAPGGYTIRCIDCAPKGFDLRKFEKIGAKRSLRCRECAEKAAASYVPAPVPPARKPVRIEYTNYKGERTIRTIMPKEFVWGSNQWHPEYQYLLFALDLDKGADRYFAMDQIHSWTVVDAPADK